MIIRAHLAGLRMAEVPITYSPDRRSRPPHLRTWRDGWRHLRFLLLFSPTWLFAVPGLLFFIFGGLASVALFIGPVHVGQVVFDVHSLIASSALSLVGLQVLLIGLLARRFASRMGVLPASRLLDQAMDFFSLEAGIGLGSVFILLGLGLLVATVTYWSAVSFGPIADVAHSLRTAVAGTSLAVAGIQFVFASFALSVVDIR
jgi:hypothetical protein